MFRFSDSSCKEKTLNGFRNWINTFSLNFYKTYLERNEYKEKCNKCKFWGHLDIDGVLYEIVWMNIQVVEENWDLGGHQY